MTAGEFKRYIAGQITADGTNEVTLSVPVLEESSVVLLSLRTVGGTPNNVYVFSKDVANKTIGFKSAASNTSVYDVVVLP